MKQRVAVIGAGISGLATAWLLRRHYEVTLFEANHYLGGHTNTIDVVLEGKTHPVDTGFLVFNNHTYPNLIALFDLLGVDSVATEMSFSVSLERPDLEWAGTNLATLFGQKRNLLRGQFWAMLRDIVRFNRESMAGRCCGSIGNAARLS
jgi:predicted NAD/FAD-binding protein